ncbi:unnamed protein product [Amoebophrya sp. A25]|nr:unnamed protein product [Amoebophrya sp. A25]|eukprot:GSA25T00011257001.1
MTEVLEPHENYESSHRDPAFPTYRIPPSIGSMEAEGVPPRGADAVLGGVTTALAATASPRGTHFHQLSLLKRKHPRLRKMTNPTADFSDATDSGTASGIPQYHSAYPTTASPSGGPASTPLGGGGELVLTNACPPSGVTSAGIVPSTRATSMVIEPVRAPYNPVWGAGVNGPSVSAHMRSSGSSPATDQPVSIPGGGFASFLQEDAGAAGGHAATLCSPPPGGATGSASSPISAPPNLGSPSGNAVPPSDLRKQTIVRSNAAATPAAPESGIENAHPNENLFSKEAAPGASSSPTGSVAPPCSVRISQARSQLNQYATRCPRTHPTKSDYAKISSRIDAGPPASVLAARRDSSASSASGGGASSSPTPGGGGGAVSSSPGNPGVGSNPAPANTAAGVPTSTSGGAGRTSAVASHIVHVRRRPSHAARVGASGGGAAAVASNSKPGGDSCSVATAVLGGLPPTIHAARISYASTRSGSAASSSSSSSTTSGGGRGRISVRALGADAEPHPSEDVAGTPGSAIPALAALQSKSNTRKRKLAVSDESRGAVAVGTAQQQQSGPTERPLSGKAQAKQKPRYASGAGQPTGAARLKTRPAAKSNADVVLSAAEDAQENKSGVQRNPWNASNRSGARLGGPRGKTRSTTAPAPSDGLDVNEKSDVTASQESQNHINEAEAKGNDDTIKVPATVSASLRVTEANHFGASITKVDPVGVEDLQKSIDSPATVELPFPETSALDYALLQPSSSLFSDLKNQPEPEAMVPHEGTQEQPHTAIVDMRTPAEMFLPAQSAALLPPSAPAPAAGNHNELEEVHVGHQHVESDGPVQTGVVASTAGVADASEEVNIDAVGKSSLRPSVDALLQPASTAAPALATSIAAEESRLELLQSLTKLEEGNLDLRLRARAAALDPSCAIASVSGADEVQLHDRLQSKEEQHTIVIPAGQHIVLVGVPPASSSCTRSTSASSSMTAAAHAEGNPYQNQSNVKSDAFALLSNKDPRLAVAANVHQRDGCVEEQEQMGSLPAGEQARSEAVRRRATDSATSPILTDRDLVEQALTKSSQAEPPTQDRSGSSHMAYKMQDAGTGDRRGIFDNNPLGGAQMKGWRAEGVDPHVDAGTQVGLVGEHGTFELQEPLRVGGSVRHLPQLDKDTHRSDEPAGPPSPGATYTTQFDSSIDNEALVGGSHSITEQQRVRDCVQLEGGPHQPVDVAEEGEDLLQHTTKTTLHGMELPAPLQLTANSSKDATSTSTMLTSLKTLKNRESSTATLPPANSERSDTTGIANKMGRPRNSTLDHTTSGSLIAQAPAGSSLQDNPVQPKSSPTGREGAPPAIAIAGGGAENQLLALDPESGLWIPPREDSRVPCPYCGRNFNEEAAARHIPRCKEIKNRPAARSTHKKEYMVDKLGRRVEVARPKAKAKLPGAAAGEGEGANASAGGNAAPANETSTGTGTAVPPALDSQWGQVQILLSQGIKAVDSETELEKTLQSAKDGLQWVADVEHFSQKCGIMKGRLSRLLLPFNKDTDAKDQANIKSDLGSPELDALKIPMETRKQMVRQALKVRKFLRVKVADDADMDLLKDSLQLILAFMQNLHQFMRMLADKGEIAASMPCSKFIVQKLGEPFKHKFRDGPAQGGSIFDNDRDYFKY